MATTIQKRTVKRSRVFLTGTAVLPAGSQEVRIRDVSTEGALLEAASQPSTGDPIQVHCGDTVAEGRVAWIDGSWFGVQFLDALPVGTLVDSMGAKLKVSAPRTHRFDRSGDPHEPEVGAPEMRLGQGLH